MELKQEILQPSWDELFMRHAYLISSKSKDNRTKIGAVLVREKRIISEGYNGIPAGVNDCCPERFLRPEKYFWLEHAERNSVYGCARYGISSLGSIMYTQGVPCADCARSVIQAGIKEVIVHKQWQDYEVKFYWEKWLESGKRSTAMLNEAGIPVRVFDMALGLKSMLDGKIIEL
jgi:dCMP deaminase